MRLARLGRDPFTSKVVDSLFVGETENIGNPRTDAEKAYGRSLPKPQMPDFPIRGYEYYDYRHDVENVTFRNYEDNATRKTGALSYLMYTSAGVSTENAIERAKFVNAKPVYFPPMERKWGNDNLNGVAWKTAAIHDKDGSVGGVPNSYILIHDGVNDSIATDAQACEIKPDLERCGVQGRYRTHDFWRRRRRCESAAVGRRSRGAGGAGPGAAGPGAAPVLASCAGGGWSRRSRCCRSWRTWWSSRRWRSQLLLSRQSFSAAMARSSPPTASNVRAGTEIKVTTERPSMSLTLTEMDAGSWVIFELPGFTTAASGTEQSSLDALRKASDTSYFKGKDALWVKVVSNGNGAARPQWRRPWWWRPASGQPVSCNV